jgi:alanyl-tRNA synthetase
MNWLATATKAAVASGIHCGNIVKALATVTGGGGGGKPDSAQAGGKNPAKAAEAFAKLEELLG